MKIGLIVGSLRKESYNKKVAEVVKTLFPSDYDVEFIEVKDVPFYNEDDDGDTPIKAYTDIRDKVREKDGFIFFTPEYNRSYAPALKNVIDVASRDKRGNPWSKKVATVITASQGGLGGMAANHALRQVFVVMDIIPLQQPEAYLSNIQDYFKDGEMVESTKNFLQKVVDAYVKLIEKLR